MSYRDHFRAPRAGEFGFQPSHSWAALTADRLRWRYGEARARQILDGKDPNANADLAAWRRLCARARP